MVSGEFVIGDDLAFELNNVKSGKSNMPLPAATITWEFIEATTRTQIATGNSMALYDAITASYESVIPKASLSLWNGQRGVKPGHLYALRAKIVNNGIQTTKGLILRAMLDPEGEQ